MMAFLARIGAPVRGFLEFLGDQAHLVWRTLRSGLALRSGQLAVVGGQTKLQIRFTGLDAAVLVVGTALLLGAVTLIQAFSQLSGLGAENYIGTLMVLIILRELGPLLTAVLVIGRSATAIAGEDCTLVMVEQRSFNDLLRRVPGLGLEIMKVMASRLRRASRSD